MDDLSKYIKKIYQEYTFPDKKNNIIITGGSSKELLLKNLKFTHGFTNVWWSDERHLYYKNQARNSYLKPHQKKLVNKLNIQINNIPYYKNENKSSIIYSTKINKVNIFNIGFFSLGADNHFASLFEIFSRENLENNNSFFPIINNNNEFPHRITMNPLLLNKVNQIFCLVTGENKKDALNNLLHKKKVPSIMLAKYSINFTILTLI
jgi:6-phosphogluconolactonase/glucosamine-6-phosphate isomerase/deaminase